MERRFASLPILMTVLVVALTAQNLQLHYDGARRHLTATLELYQQDRWGAWFTFVDFDFNRQLSSAANGISAAYWEITRYFRLPFKDSWSLTLQYNDGLDKSFLFNPVWLGGVQYLFTRGNMALPVDFLLRRELNTNCWTLQLTAVWQQRYKKWEVTGFVDVWNTGSGGYPARKLAFMAEPQVWYYLSENLAVGGEIEISYNFSGAWSQSRGFVPDRLFCLPTLGCKWAF